MMDILRNALLCIRKTIRENCIEAGIDYEINPFYNIAVDALNSDTQCTKCAVCQEYKYCPLRRDEMGGYVCLTCIDKELDKK